MTLTNLILLYGESPNDTHALENLIIGLLPLNKSITFRKLRNPVILSHKAQQRKRAAIGKLIAAVERAERSRYGCVVVVAHRDCDAIEPAHVTNSNALVADMKACGVDRVVAATPAWCIETWWMQFSSEVAKVRPCWNSINFKSLSLGHIADAKKMFARAVRNPARKSCPEYSESDSISIAEQIKISGAARHPVRLASGSLTLFRERLLQEIK